MVGLAREHIQRMAMGELEEEEEEEEELRETARRFETCLELASWGGDEGRQLRECLRAEFDSAAMEEGDAGRVASRLLNMLLGAEGHTGLLGGKDGVPKPVRAYLTELFGPAVRASADRLACRLLELGASPTVKHRIFGAPIHAAVGKEDILRLLLSNDSADKDELDHEGNSPLFLAVREGHVPSVKFLLTAGADSGLRVEADLDYLYDDAEDTDGWAALDLAASAGRADLCKLLVEAGANVNATSKRCSRTPLHAAAGSNQVGAIDTLIKLGANIAGDIAASFETPVDIAGKTGSLEAIAALARHGAVLNDALQHATIHSKLKVVVALLEAGADPNEANFEGCTPMLTAAESWPSEEVLRALLRHGAQIDVTDNFGRTPLHIAASEGAWGWRK